MPGLLEMIRPGRVMRSAASARGPVAVDLGSEALRMTQVTVDGRLAAAACVDVPPHLADDFQGFIRSLPELLREAVTCGATGRRVVVSLPASRVHWATLRMPKLPPEQLADALRYEAADKLPLDTSRAVVRHEVAGEVHTKDGPRLEVLVSAAAAADVEAVLGACEQARLEPVGVRAAPLAFRDGIARYYMRDDDATCTFLAVDLGRRASRAFVLRGGSMTFVRGIDFGVQTAYEAAAAASGRDAADVRRERTGQVPAPTPAPAEGLAMLGAALRRAEDASPAPASDADLVRHATTLAGELARCRQYHDATFPGRAVERLIFFGGGAADVSLCREVARRVGVAAQVGDFACRVVGEIDLPDDNAPAWSLSLGLAACVPVVR